MAALLQSRWGRVVAAAARLAAIYAVGVAILLLAGLPFVNRTLPAWRDLLGIALPIGVLFAVAFVMLAVARRAGFVALWLVLVGMWIWMIAQVIGDVRMLSIVATAFFVWSVAALPLYTMGAVGLPARKRIAVGRGRMSLTTLVFLVWGVLAAGALYFAGLDVGPHRRVAPHGVLATWARFIWGPAPIVIAVLAIVHVWKGTGVPRAVEGEQLGG